MPSYDASFFDYVNASARAAAQRMVPLLQQQLAPPSVLDVGCGQGAWLAVWQQHGVDDVFGVDGSYVDRGRLLFAAERFYAHDLAQPFDLGRRFGLVECLEVAEHLPEASAGTLVDSLVRHGEVIVFSAAPPGRAATTMSTNAAMTIGAHCSGSAATWRPTTCGRASGPMPRRSLVSI